LYHTYKDLKLGYTNFFFFGWCRLYRTYRV